MLINNYKVEKNKATLVNSTSSVIREGNQIHEALDAPKYLFPKLFPAHNIGKDILRIAEKLPELASALESCNVEIENQFVDLLVKNQINSFLIKSAVRPFDSFIIKVNKFQKSFSLKLHAGYYPLCGHIYNSPRLLRAIAKTGAAAPVKYTRQILVGSTPLRLTLYEYQQGLNLKNLLPGAPLVIETTLQDMLRSNIKSLLSVGVNPILKDPSDYLLVFKKTSVLTTKEKEDILEKIKKQPEVLVKYASSLQLILTDYNTLTDISNSSKDSRAGIQKIVLDQVANKIMSSSWIPSSERILID